MSTILKVNNKAVIEYTNKLEKMRKYDLPLAVRGTLNKAAFNLKQVTMPASAEATFTKRKENFFKANSRVQMANGFNINSMRSVVGFTTMNAKENYKSVLELKQQEHGGVIPDRDYIPLDEARIGNSASKQVSAPNRIKKINLSAVVHAKNMPGSRKQKFLAAAIKASKGGYVTAGLNKQLLRKVLSIKYVDGRTVVKSKAIYSHKPNRNVKIDSTFFMKKASINTSKKLNTFYISEAQRRIAKFSK